MTNIEQDRWSRVKGRLRSTVGEDVYTSWLPRMDLESVQQESVRYRFRPGSSRAGFRRITPSGFSLLAGRDAGMHRIDLTVRTAMALRDAARNSLRSMRAGPSGRWPRYARTASATGSAVSASP